MVDPSHYRIKLIDFGMSKFLSSTSKLETDCGTLDFIAPEIFNEDSYNEKCDIWSVGVAAFLLASGQFPFWDVNVAKIK